MELVSAADENSEGPARFMLLDPDGNPISLINMCEYTILAGKKGSTSR